MERENIQNKRLRITKTFVILHSKNRSYDFCKPILWTKGEVCGQTRNALLTNRHWTFLFWVCVR